MCYSKDLAEELNKVDRKDNNKLIMKTILIIHLLAAAIIAIEAKKPTFPIHLFRNTITDNPDTNIVISPPLIKVSLSMLLMGLSGSAEKEIFKGLQLSGSSKAHIPQNIHHNELEPLKNLSLQMANGIFVDKDITVSSSFSDSAQLYFDGEVKTVHGFTEETRSIINTWIAEKTGAFNKDFIEKRDFESPTRMLLASGINFNGGLRNVFHQKNTNSKVFRVNRLKATKVKMMRTRGEFAKGYLKQWDANAVILPYLNDDIHMVILMPTNKAVEFNDNKANRALEYMEFKMYDLSLYDLNSKLIIDTIEVHLPQFKIEFNSNMEQVIRQLGIKKIFEEGVANFSSFSSTSDDLAVVMEHKALIEINEGVKSGKTEPTSPSSSIRTIQKRNVERFIVNRPFFFAIMDLKRIYLMGHVIHF